MPNTPSILVGGFATQVGAALALQNDGDGNPGAVSDDNPLAGGGGAGTGQAHTPPSVLSGGFYFPVEAVVATFNDAGGNPVAVSAAHPLPSV